MTQFLGANDRSIEHANRTGIRIFLNLSFANLEAPSVKSKILPGARVSRLTI
jgi:hypothetical protein